jgi:hypothetical protein
MMIFARRIERPLDVPVQCPHDADPREHRWAAERRHKDQGFHGRLPFRGFVLRFRKLRNVGAGILESDDLATARQQYGSLNRRFQPLSTRAYPCPRPAVLNRPPSTVRYFRNSPEDSSGPGNFGREQGFAVG